jgi:hypothetical protein
MQDITKIFNDFHDEYRRFEKESRRDYDLHYSMTVSIIPQWGRPTADPAVQNGLHPVHRLEPVHRDRGRIGLVHLCDAANPILD